MGVPRDLDLVQRRELIMWPLALYLVRCFIRRIYPAPLVMGRSRLTIIKILTCDWGLAPCDPTGLQNNWCVEYSMAEQMAALSQIRVDCALLR